MTKWIKYSDNFYVNEETKEVVSYRTYGANNEYFLSQQGYYEEDPYEEIDMDILVNDDCTPDTIDELINKTLSMAGIECNMTRPISLRTYLENELEEAIEVEYEDMIKRFITRLDDLEAKELELRTIKNG